MENLSYIAFLCVVIALGMMIPLMEKNARKIIIFLIVGMFCCLFVSEVNTFFLELFDRDMIYVTTTVTPITEEIVKALPVLYFAVVISDDRRMLIMIAYAVGVGFALLENIIVLMQNIDQVTVLWALIRGFGAGLVHGICTVMVGYGISYVRQQKKLFRVGTYALLSAAVIYHAIYNILVQSRWSYVGILLPMVTYIPAILLL
ncbi:MAG: PrsW family intramembrane metalloprotease, partial [Lachnospiraceae bacterium]|nr:PrsW family intramembrane metalloprotease [Lachnospiraceae bacterium]